MSEKKEAVPEVAGLPRSNAPDVGAEHYVPDYVVRDFGEADETMSSSGRVSGRYSDTSFLL